MSETAFVRKQKAAIKSLVPQAGLEPARRCRQQILSLPRLPIPPLGLGPEHGVSVACGQPALLPSGPDADGQGRGARAKASGMLRNLYDKVIALSESRHALPTLAAVSFAESSFFPVPPDVVLVPMALAKPEKARLYALVCTVASVAGGILGYAIGAYLYDTLGKWL